MSLETVSNMAGDDSGEQMARTTRTARGWRC